MTPFQRAVPNHETVERTRLDMYRELRERPEKYAAHGVTTEHQIDELIARSTQDGELWQNDKYCVTIYRDGPTEGWPAMIHLSIRRLDREPIRDWRDFQQIKNMLVGTENEGVELYPAESRIVDSANQYHVFCLADARMRFPFGFRTKLVDESTVGSSRQRPFDEKA